MAKTYDRSKLKQEWAKRFQPLVGRRITSVRWMTPAEQKLLDWFEAAIIIQLDDGTFLFPSRDDEGNGAGALYVEAGRMTRNTTVESIAPVI